ncbi:MAG TPA: hypothetical protein VK842_00420, partial [bacterium]|nr:hypothetical protein [bacterium]
VIEVYNAAFQRVAVVTDDARGGYQITNCVPITRLPSGVYLCKSRVGDQELPMSEFGVSR